MERLLLCVTDVMYHDQNNTKSGPNKFLTWKYGPWDKIRNSRSNLISWSILKENLGVTRRIEYMNQSEASEITCKGILDSEGTVGFVRTGGIGGRFRLRCGCSCFLQLNVSNPVKLRAGNWSTGGRVPQGRSRRSHFWRSFGELHER